MQIEAITAIDELRDKLMEEENMDLLMECGYNKPVSRVELEDKPNIIQTVTLHKVILASLAELSQFRKGLSALGVDAALKAYPHLLHSYFSIEHKDELTSGMCIEVYIIQWYRLHCEFHACRFHS